jgi:membrane protein implicated in regulation of membrane protease activity
MVTTKPCPRWLIWTGKWFGVFFMHVVILFAAAAVILALVLWRTSREDFPEAEMLRLRSEVMVGRRAFGPEQPPFAQIVEQEYRQRLPELDKAHDPAAVKAEILRQAMARSGDVPAGGQRVWAFRGVQVRDPQEPLFLRYRFYSGSTSQSDQKEVPGLWLLRDPASPPGQDRVFPYPAKALGGTFHEMPVDPAFVGPDGALMIAYINPPAEAEEWGTIKPVSAIFQNADGPSLLVRVTGFSANYARSLLLAVFQIGFLAALGCMVGAAFSTPVAAFVAISYLIIGMGVRAAVDAPLKDDFGKYQYKGTVDMVAHRFARVVKAAVVSVDEMDATSDLARGRLIEWGRIGGDLIRLVLVRGGIIAAVGMWVLTRRELGTVIRR